MTTSSKVALETVKKVIKMLTELNVPIIGIIENMKMEESRLVKEALKDVPILGEVGFDEKIEDSIGDVNKLLESDFAVKMKEIVSNSSILKLQLK